MPAAIIVTQVTDCWMASSDSKWGGQCQEWRIQAPKDSALGRNQTKPGPGNLDTTRTQTQTRTRFPPGPGDRVCINITSDKLSRYTRVREVGNYLPLSHSSLSAPFPPAVLQVVAMCRVRGNWDGRWIRIRIRIGICWWSPPHSSKPTFRGFRCAINVFEKRQKSILPALQDGWCTKKKLSLKIITSKVA